MSHWTGKFSRNATLNGGQPRRLMPPGAVFNPATTPSILFPVLEAILAAVGGTTSTSPVFLYAEDLLVPYDIETTIFSHTVAILPLSMKSLNFSGNWDGIYRVYINTVLKLDKRTSAAQRTTEHYFSPPYELVVGDTVDISVIHDRVAGTRSFNASLIGSS